MSEENDKDLEKTEELFKFLQGIVPEGYHIQRGHVPKLTAHQAWTVIWYLGNQFWQVKDCIYRCDVCGDIYHSWQEGACLDYGKGPYFFCDSCMEKDVFRNKQNSRLNPDRAALMKGEA